MDDIQNIFNIILETCNFIYCQNTKTLLNEIVYTGKSYSGILDDICCTYAEIFYLLIQDFFPKNN